MPADITVVICSLNGAEGVERCLGALAAQTAPVHQVVVVDDGSSDDTSVVARRHGAQVVRHGVNRGLAAARNSGVEAATGDVVAFLDDDCEPQAEWAEELGRCWAAAGPEVAGIGGPVRPASANGYTLGFLTRHNPLRPLEGELADGDGIAHRLKLYLRRQWSRPSHVDIRQVYSLVGANMSFRRTGLHAVGGFDERFRFGAEEVELCRRLAREDHGLLVTPHAVVWHHFEASLEDVLRRSRAYGRGSARLYRTGCTGWPTLFPGPVLVLAVLVAALMRRRLPLAAFVLPHLLYPLGIRDALAGRTTAPLADPYVRLAQEVCENTGLLAGLYRFRHLARRDVPR